MSRNIAKEFTEAIKSNSEKIQEIKEFYNFDKEIVFRLFTSDNNFAHQIAYETANIPIPIQQFYSDLLRSIVNEG
jgi:predicted choloylglycine hydrolase